MFDTLKQRVNSWRMYREAVRQLRALDDHILADLGIRRSQIPAYIRRRLAEMACD